MKKKHLRYIILLPILYLLPQFGSVQSIKDFQKLTGRALALAESSAQDEVNRYWLFLEENSRSSQPVMLTEKARKRRAKVDPDGLLIDEKDFPISNDILERIKLTGAEIRRVSRWLNAVSVDASNSQLIPLASLSEVKRIDIVEILKATSPDVTVGEKYDKVLSYGTKDLEYGYSLFQNQFINAIKLHQVGYTGRGIMMALFDSGFDIYHHAFDSASVLSTWDFINDDATVDEPGCPDESTSLYQDNHGTSVMGIIGGNIPDTLIGAAPHVDFILAKTEITCGGLEIKIEEDNWVAAAQWADSIGADIINSSLGYATFQDSGSYSISDLDGNTSLITIAADIAASKNILVVVSAGNERGTYWNRITMPADGDSVLAVGAVNGDSSLASFSSPGPTADGRIKPDIVTLGVGVVTASHLGGLKYANGTSMSAPLVAGGAALAFEMDSTLTADELLNKIRNTGDRRDNPDNSFGYGLYDATKSSTIIQIDPVDDIWLYIGEQVSVEITTSGLADNIPVLSAFNLPAWAEFTDNLDGTAQLTLNGTVQNQINTEIGLVLDVGYYVDTGYINVISVGYSDRAVSAGPNPFSDSVYIFIIPEAGLWETVSVFNLAGEIVWEKVNSSGVYADTPIKWDGRNLSGKETSAGVYLVHVRTEKDDFRLKLLKID